MLCVSFIGFIERSSGIGLLPGAERRLHEMQEVAAFLFESFLKPLRVASRLRAHIRGPTKELEFIIGCLVLGHLCTTESILDAAK